MPLARPAALIASAPHLDAECIFHASSMNGGAPAIALTDRAEKRATFPAHPLFHRALADDILLDVLKDAASGLGYALR